MLGSYLNKHVYEYSNEDAVYASPEKKNDIHYSKTVKSEIWALGILLMEMCLLELPKISLDAASITKSIYAMQYSESIHRLLTMTLRLNPEQRPSAK